MADKKASEFDVVTALATGDRVLALDTAPENKLVTIAIENLRKEAHGSLSVTGGSTPQTLTSTPAKVTAWTAAVSGAVLVADHSADTIGIPDAGVYQAQLNLVLDVSAGDTFRFYVYWNGSQQGTYVEHIRSGTGRFSVNLTARIAALSTSQACEVRASAASGADITIAEGSFDVWRIA